ncbi:pyrroline-5-carboxylate reductase dimerization domain-containing protein [Brevibacillus ginsengisoli]|uniref:pyrroline-5-carboxylate reductase dimerization domain-containing protein n=1 Tax=Brevibacillus ginsengisoli TaxID=363854 RepID=UPI003CE99C62
MNIGIIGLGSMGSMLVKGFSKSRVVSPSQLYAYNRTTAKSHQLNQEYPFTVCEEMKTLCAQADLIFICTKPLDIYPVLQEIKRLVSNSAHLVSVAAGVSLDDLASVYDGPVSKVIPTVTSQELHGVSLFACHERVSDQQHDDLVKLLNAIGEAQEISESAIETATILTSSGPGLIAGIMEQFAQAAFRQTPEFALDTYRHMLVETLLGTATLLKNKQLSFDQCIEQVATKGGITEEGLGVLGRTLPQAFDELLKMTESKHALLKEKVKEQFKP